MTRRKDGDVDRRTRAFIIAALRKLSLRHPARIRAKNKNKVDKALFACDNCETLTYEGVSDKNMDALQQKYPKHTIVKGRIELDHIVAVVGMGGFEDWNHYIPNLFCDESNFSPLCTSCHKEKTKKENKKRKK